MEEVLLGRHSEAEHNKGGYFAGGQIDTELTIKGEQDAILRGEQMAELDLPGVIICSPMLRAYKTAEIIAKTFKKKRNVTIPIHSLDLLKEIDVGKFSGLTTEEAIQMFPKRMNTFTNQDVTSWDFPGGESYEDVVNRISPLPKKLHSYKGKKILLIAHGMVNRCIMSYYEKESDTDFSHEKIVSCPELASLII